MVRSDLPRVIRRALGLMSFARKGIGASASSLFLVSENDGSLHGLVSEWDWTRTSFSTKLDDWPGVAASLAGGDLTRIDASAARGAEVGWFEARGIVGTVCVPMRGRTRALGVLFFDFADDVPLETPARALLEDVGRRCARALVRASLAVPPEHARWMQ